MKSDELLTLTENTPVFQVQNMVGSFLHKLDSVARRNRITLVNMEDVRQEIAKDLIVQHNSGGKVIKGADIDKFIKSYRESVSFKEVIFTEIRKFIEDLKLLSKEEDYKWIDIRSIINSMARLDYR